MQAHLIYHHIHEPGHPTRSRISIIIINIIIISILILIIYHHPLAQHNACKCPCVFVCLFQCNPLHTPTNSEYPMQTIEDQHNKPATGKKKCIPTPMATQKNLCLQLSWPPFLLAAYRPWL